MEQYARQIHAAFQEGELESARFLFETAVKNAFPTFSFRGCEMTHFLPEKQYIAGHSWNHCFTVRITELENHPVWEVCCRRTAQSKTPLRIVLLVHDTMEFIKYREEAQI